MHKQTASQLLRISRDAKIVCVASLNGFGCRVRFILLCCTATNKLLFTYTVILYLCTTTTATAAVAGA